MYSRAGFLAIELRYDLREVITRDKESGSYRSLSFRGISSIKAMLSAVLLIRVVLSLALPAHGVMRRHLAPGPKN